MIKITMEMGANKKHPDYTEVIPKLPNTTANINKRQKIPQYPSLPVERQHKCAVFLDVSVIFG